MRKITIFAASFILVLIAGAAFAQIGDQPRGVEEDGDDPAATASLEPLPDPEPRDLESGRQGEEAADEPEEPKPVQPEEDEQAEPGTELGELEQYDDTADPTADTTALEFVILHPIDGQVFEAREAVFEGRVEPGARVFAGQYEADVSEEGGWRIVLLLNAGNNTATLKAVDAAGNVATDSVHVIYAAPLEGKEAEEKTGEFAAFTTYGSCAENPPYDIYYGTGVPGTGIIVTSEYGSEDVRVSDSGHWEIKVVFWEAPIGEPFLVIVKDTLGHSKHFEFTRLG